MPTARPDTYNIASGATLAAGAYISGGGPAPSLPITLDFDEPIPQHIALRCPIVGAVPEGTEVRPQYKIFGSSTWITGEKMSRLRLSELTQFGALPTAIGAFMTDSFVGMCLLVAAASTSAQTFDVRLQITPPTGAVQYSAVAPHTLRRIEAPAGAITHNCTPANWAATVASLPHESGAVVHLRMAPGTYAWSNVLWNKGGTASAKLYVTAATLGDVVISTPTGTCMTPGAHHVVWERIRWTGSNANGPANDSIWINNPGGLTDWQSWAFQNCEVLGFSIGCRSYAPLTSWHFWRTKLVGNLVWADTFLPNGFGQSNNNKSWDNHGLCLPGRGNTATECEISNFGDAFRTYANASSKQATRACGMTYCLIKNTCDDMLEADATCGNTFAVRCKGVNLGNGVSLDTAYGPVYVTQLVAINVTRGPKKTTNDSFGARFWNCTFVLSAKGQDDHGMYATGSANIMRQHQMRNCLIHYIGAGNALHWTPSLPESEWGSNAWFPDRGFFINNELLTTSLAAAKTAVPARFANDVLLSAQPFAAPIALAATTQPEYAGQTDVTLAAGQAALLGGDVIVGVTDGFTGASPSRGAVVTGQPPISYGVPAAAALPTWVPAFSSTLATVNTLTVANGGLESNYNASTAPNYEPFYTEKTVNDYSGGALNSDYGTWGAYLLFGGGHSGTNDNALRAMVLGATQVSFKIVIDPSPTFDGHLAGGPDLPTRTLAEVKGLNSGASYNFTTTFGDALGKSRVDEITASQKVDGKPASPHSYDVPLVIPSVHGGSACGTFFMAGIPAANRDGSLRTGSMTTYIAELASTNTPSNVQQWQRLFTHPTYPNGAVQVPPTLGNYSAPSVHAVFDPVHNRVLYESGNNFPPRWVARGASTAAQAWNQGSGTALNKTDNGTHEKRYLYIPERDLFVWVYRRSGGGDLGIKWMVNAPDPSWDNTGAALSQRPLLDTDWSCATWCKDSPDGGRILVLDLSGNRLEYAEVKIPNVLTAAWPVALVPFSSLVPFKTARNDNASIYGRCEYNPKTKAIPLLISGVSPTQVHVIRPRGV